MYIALDKENNRVSIDNVIPGEKYFCPICGEELIIRAKDSVAIKPHFAHKKGHDCDDFSHDMSEWHLSWQNRFPEECREVVVDNGTEIHRADVLINNTIIEFQHSPIKAEEIARRNTFYFSCGYKMVWVFDAEGQIKNKTEGLLDPAFCSENDLCWKRAKQQFTTIMPKEVVIFLHYKTELKQCNHGGEQEIMLLLTNCQPKYFTFLKTQISDTNYLYITPFNFIKEYMEIADGIYSFSTIIALSERYRNAKVNQLRHIRMSNSRASAHLLPRKRRWRF